MLQLFALFHLGKCLGVWEIAWQQGLHAEEHGACVWDTAVPLLCRWGRLRDMANTGEGLPCTYVNAWGSKSC